MDNCIKKLIEIGDIVSIRESKHKTYKCVCDVCESKLIKISELSVGNTLVFVNDKYMTFHGAFKYYDTVAFMCFLDEKDFLSDVNDTTDYYDATDDIENLDVNYWLSI